MQLKPIGNFIFLRMRVLSLLVKKYIWFCEQAIKTNEIRGCTKVLALQLQSKPSVNWFKHLDGSDLFWRDCFQLFRTKFSNGAERGLSGEAGDVAARITGSGAAQLIDLFCCQRIGVFRQQLD